MIISRGVGGLSAGEELHAKLTQAGVGPKRLEKQGAAPASSVKQDRDGVVVTLSIDPKAINALIQKQEDKVDLRSAAGFRDFLKSFHDELRDSEKDSKMLNELPESSDPARLSLAKQQQIISCKHQASRWYMVISQQIALFQNWEEKPYQTLLLMIQAPMPRQMGLWFLLR